LYTKKSLLSRCRTILAHKSDSLCWLCPKQPGIQHKPALRVRVSRVKFRIVDYPSEGRNVHLLQCDLWAAGFAVILHLPLTLQKQWSRMWLCIKWI